ncbi:MAG: chromosomal replication initiator protein DnaA [Lentisphaeria bacterium]|nr:chromosomal replication initiator protein DnaA [Lentisphaeria bacterium]
MKTDFSAIWTVAAERLRQMNETCFRQYICRLVPLRCADGVLTVGVPDDFFGDIVRNQFGDLILQALTDIDGVDYTYEFEAGHEAPLPPAVEPAAPKKPEPVRPRSGVGSSVSGERPRMNSSTEHTFENFIVGEENRIAFAAARAAAEEPGLYNPLFIYGTNGIGKTHLLQAVAAYMRGKSSKIRIRSTTCDEMLNDFYELLAQHKSLSEFRSSMRNVDVLLVDDVHRLAKKPQMQEEFFNVFNTLYRQHKQIILTSDRQPCEISDIDKRLSTRFESGMISELNMPGYEARLTMLRMWRGEALTKAPLSDELLEFLAQNISSSVRRLKGAFLRLTTCASLSGEEVTVSRAEDLLHAQIEQEIASRNVSPETIQRTVAAHFGISIADLLGEKRTRNIAEPRMVAMYLCRELTSCSSTEVGAAFGKNHATILYAEKKVPQLCEANESLRRAVTQIKHQLHRS